ncbi:hypothetical protein FSP39_002704 [Pinctada imbricata]|uniref:Uncharacterized protein n=1 Tax=Pinctada imbricata TaxID=66713 RepID=A0AA88YCK3_PINIB|nr:hypothetical protein FSP39_002704 [Pinctada imbricata]
MQTYVNFASDWTFVYVDDLQRFNRTVADICHMSLYDIISRREEELASCMRKELPWSFTRIQYETGNERDIEGIQQCIEYLSSPEMMRFLYELVSMTIKPIKDDEEIKDSVEWIKSVSKDRKLMFEASTFRGAIERYVERTVVDMLAKVIYRLEDLGALDALHSSTETNDKQEYIKRSVQDIELLAVDSMQQPSGPGCYIVRNYRKRRLPLSGKIFEQLKKVSAEGHFDGTLDERRVVTFTSFIRDILDKVFSRGYD